MDVERLKVKQQECMIIGERYEKITACNGSRPKVSVQRLLHIFYRDEIFFLNG